MPYPMVKHSVVCVSKHVENLYRQYFDSYLWIAATYETPTRPSLAGVIQDAANSEIKHNHYLEGFPLLFFLMAK